MSIDLSVFAPEKEKKIKLLPNDEALARYNKLTEDQKVWADETILYKYFEYANEKIEKYLKDKPTVQLKSIKAMYEVVIANDASLNERNKMHLHTICIKLWKERVST